MNPIQLTKNEDNTYTLTYFGKEVGHICKIRYLQTRNRGFRVISVHGEIGYAHGLLSAQKKLMEMYH
jgi:hypothetical protein